MQTEQATSESSSSPPVAANATVGAVSTGVALGASELAAGLISSLPSLVAGLATFVIDTVPTPIKNWAIETFGTADKLVLGAGIVVVALGLGALVGRAGRMLRVLVFAGFGLVTGLAAARDPQVDLVPSLLAGLIAAGAGLAAFSWLSRSAVPPEADRRVFLTRMGALSAFAILAAAGGRALLEKSRVMLAGREDVVLPTASETAPPPSAAAALDVPELSPIVTPNAEFYRIDTAAFSVPRVDLAGWSLGITGMVERPVSLSYQELLDMPMVERYVTLSCVSNEVGGDLVGTAKWLGVPLSDVLDLAGVTAGADQLVGRSVDGFTVGFPVEAAYDGRNALVALGMNGEPLPAEHGFPARLVVAGLYGYVSATKWLSEIELTTWDGFDAYWIPRGWSKEAPIKTQSRIDTPRSSLGSGTVPIAGVAWAPYRGISMVEVRIDQGDWRVAELSEPLSDDAWRQWRIDWNADPGGHTIEVRATDGEGQLQDSDIRPPAPDGATGYHTVVVEVA